MPLEGCNPLVARLDYENSFGLMHILNNYCSTEKPNSQPILLDGTKSDASKRLYHLYARHGRYFTATKVL